MMVRTVNVDSRQQPLFALVYVGGNPVNFAAAGVAARQRGTVIKRQFRVVFSIVSGGGRCIVV